MIHHVTIITHFFIIQEIKETEKKKKEKEKSNQRK